MKSTLVLHELEDYEAGLLSYGFTCFESSYKKTYVVPLELGKGSITNIYPNDEVALSVINLKLNYPLVMNYENYNSRFETTYCIKGHIVYSETGVADTSLGHNDMGIYIKPNSRGMMMFPSDEEILAVSLLGQNGFLENLPFREEISNSEREVNTVADALLKPHKTGVQIGNQFVQIAGFKIDDLLAPRFYEGAAKLILSMLWQEYIINPTNGIVRHSFTSYEQAALYRARDILIERYSDPPTIAQLSKMVLLNEYKLKQGFRELFGKTMHEFLRGFKMANAKSLLDNRNLTISQIAYEVGYLNVSHFARAFRKEYGKNPSDFRV